MQNMLQQEIFNINGVAYVVHPYAGIQGFTLLTRLTEIMAPVASELTKGAKPQADGTAPEQLEMGDIDIGNIITKLFASGSEKVAELVFDLVRDVYRDGAKINADREFSMNYVALVELAIAVAKYNFNGVFQKLGMSSV